ncbi:MAG: cupin domain-containing protein [Caulobacterales bacterium]
METKIGRLADAPRSSWTPTIKPDLFAGAHEARLARSLGITQFGVNHTTLEPGSISSLRHWHEGEDEFVYILSGELTLIDENGAHPLNAGDFAAFPAGVANAHHLANRSSAAASFLSIGARKRGEETIHYPDDDFGPATVVRDDNGDRVTS